MANKVVFLGSKPIGYYCFEHLIKSKDEYNIELVGLLTNNNNKLGKADLTSLAKQNNIKVLSDKEDLLKLEIDFLISVQYHEILKKKHIDHASVLAVNLHMAPLPEYRGCNQFTFAILDGKKEFGTTIHIMEEGIDSGDILFENRFKIQPDCFVNELYEKTYQHSCDLFATSIGKIFQGDYLKQAQEDLMKERGCSIHYRKEITAQKRIDLNWSEEKIWRHIRATSMPGFPPPFAEVNGHKINLEIQ